MIYISLYNSPKYGGGVEQVVRNLLNNFSEDFKKNITLICNDINESEEFVFDDIRCINLKTKRYKILDKIFLLSRLCYSFKIYNFFKKNIKEGDIVNIHGIEYSFFPSILKKSINNNFTLIVTTHGSLFEEYNNYVVKGLPWKYFYIKIFFYFWQFYFYFLEKLEVKNIDYFIHINEYFKNYYSKSYGINEKKNFVIYNGINIENRKLRSKKNDNNFSAIIVGSTFYRKGLDIAIEAVKKVNLEGRRLQLNIVGFSDFHDFTKNNSLPEYINYIGRVNPEEVKQYMDKNDFLLLPSRYESFGLVIFDSMISGIPFLIGKNAKKLEIDYESFGYVAKDYNIDTYKELCISMMNLENYNSFIENISKYDLDEFSWEKIANQYEKVFEKFTIR